MGDESIQLVDRSSLRRTDEGLEDPPGRKQDGKEPWAEASPGATSSSSFPNGFSQEAEELEAELRVPLVAGRRDRDVREEVIDFGQNGYTLVLVSSNVKLFLFMCCVASAQFGVLWLVAFSSAEYFFESGQWIVPWSDYFAVNAMKFFSLFLTFFRVTGEFKDATKMCRVVFHALKEPLSAKQWLLGLSGFIIQYVVAVLVLFMAIHLILASTTPIGTIGKLWVVYMVLEFDNHLCNFILYTYYHDEVFEWKMTIVHRRDWSPKSKQWLWCFAIPVVIGLSIVFMSFVLSVCPLTLLHYGLVRNNNPVLMLSSNLGLPGACCPPQVQWSSTKLVDDVKLQANVSAVALVPGSDVLFLDAPTFFWVVLPDGRTAPSSLQVMEGRGGDNNLALRAGQSVGKPVQIRWWLSLYHFPHQTIYEALHGEGEGSLGLYSNSLPFVGDWEVTRFPADARVRIHVTAQNPKTGALSPVPVMSGVIFRRLCPPNCHECSSKGVRGRCYRCEPGFAKVAGRCEACASGCLDCANAGPGRCDAGMCKNGTGVRQQDASCIPCAGGVNCQSCDEDAAGHSSSSSSSVQVLPCRKCSPGHGLLPNGDGCRSCEDDHCLSCSSLGECEVCSSGFTLTPSEDSDNKTATAEASPIRCRSCAANCSNCNKLGPGNCDPGKCNEGFSLSATGQCAVCSLHCLSCTSAGPGNCDVGHCKADYGLQGGKGCSKCSVDHCEACDEEIDRCEVCKEGYGLTPEKTCEACAVSCKRCTEIGSCAECDIGFGLSQGRCLACADQCLRCTAGGPGRCDVGHCAEGWISVQASGSTNASEVVCHRNSSRSGDFLT